MPARRSAGAGETGSLFPNTFDRSEYELLFGITLREFSHSILDLLSERLCFLLVFGELVFTLINCNPLFFVLLPVLVHFFFDPADPGRDALIAGLRRLKVAKLDLEFISLRFLLYELGSMSRFIE